MAGKDPSAAAVADEGAGATRRRKRSGEETVQQPAAAPEVSAAEAAAAAEAARIASATRSPEDLRRERVENIRGFVLRTALLAAALYFNSSAKDTAAGDESVAAKVAAVSPAPTRPSVFNPFTQADTGPKPDYFDKVLRNAWTGGTPCSLRLFMSESEKLTVTDVRALELEPVWAVDGLKFDGDTSNERAVNVTLSVPVAVNAQNGSWWAHAFLAKPDVWRAESDEDFAAVDLEGDVLYARYNLVRWMKKPKVQKNLLDDVKVDGSADAAAGDAAGSEPEQLWKPVVPIELIYELKNVKLAAMPAKVASEYRVSKDETMYYPPFVVNDFWIIRDQLQRMNESVMDVTLEISFRPISLTKWSIIRSIEGMWETQMQLGTLRENEPDDLKRMLLDTNPILLGTTMVVSMAHSVLEALAFKSDIAHWNTIKNMEGVSVRSMMWNIVMQMIIFLYLFDNETSWMITIGNGIGIAIEVWKLRKAVKIKSFGKTKLLGVIPWFELQHDETYNDKTKEHDDEAMRYLGWVAIPCVIGYAIYSLKYEKHKSWYSWVVGSLVGVVYTFGFLMMLPQVLINYRLKSVAHMPMKAFAFKFLNTIIDDLFSFIIKMPWLHRLACFRDDVVFVIFLYQMYIYPVDKTRVNEFGQRGEESTEAVPEASEASKTATEKKTD
jgi:Cleft lip and palate transmembrane protein 1 (CLPTM1)